VLSHNLLVPSSPAQESIATAGLLPPNTPPPKLSDQEICELIFFPVVNEGCRVVAEGIVDKPADLDVCSVMAMGFPPYRWAQRSSDELAG
jgi:enoyl-CoA hydratase/3-hydroxyacyl-CoA dehydrogenase